MHIMQKIEQFYLFASHGAPLLLAWNVY